MIILILWTGVTYFMWLRAHLTLKSRKVTQIPAGYCSIVYLAEVIQGELRNEGKTSMLQDDRALERYIRESLKGGNIMLPSDGPSAPHSMRKSFGAWVKRHKGRIGIMVAYTLYCILGWLFMFTRALGYIYISVVMAWPFMLFALLVGSTVESTGILAFCGIVVGLLFAIPIFK